MTSQKISRRISNIIEYEPSWFSESGSALGILLWGYFALISDDYAVTGGAWVMPAVGLLFGPIRMLALFNLTPMLRVLLAAVAIIWWGWLIATLYAFKGSIPALSGYSIGAYMDVLTVARFSLIARRGYHGAE